LFNHVALVSVAFQEHFDFLKDLGENYS
jgi:hypothetical protein